MVCRLKTRIDYYVRCTRSQTVQTRTVKRGIHGSILRLHCISGRTGTSEYACFDSIAARSGQHYTESYARTSRSNRLRAQITCLMIKWSIDPFSYCHSERGTHLREQRPLVELTVAYCSDLCTVAHCTSAAGPGCVSNLPPPLPNAIASAPRVRHFSH